MKALRVVRTAAELGSVKGRAWGRRNRGRLDATSGVLIARAAGASHLIAIECGEATVEDAAEFGLAFINAAWIAGCAK